MLLICAHAGSKRTSYSEIQGPVLMVHHCFMQPVSYTKYTGLLQIQPCALCVHEHVSKQCQWKSFYCETCKRSFRRAQDKEDLSAQSLMLDMTIADESVRIFKKQKHHPEDGVQVCACTCTLNVCAYHIPQSVQSVQTVASSSYNSFLIVSPCTSRSSHILWSPQICKQQIPAVTNNIIIASSNRCTQMVNCIMLVSKECVVCVRQCELC